MHFKLGRKWIYAGLCLLGLALYWKALPNAFLFDDEEQIVANPLIQSLENIPGFFTQSTMNSGGAAKLSGVYYKPLMTSAYAVLWALAGNNPFAFHLFQLVVHIINSLLVFTFLDWFTESFFKTRVIPLLAALIFLVHPMNTECVVYSADLQDVLFLFFGMVALLFSARARSFGWKSGVGLSALLLCSLFSKESGALFLPATVLFFYFFRRKEWQRGAFAAGIAAGIYAWMRFGVAELISVKQDIVQIGRVSLDLRLLSIPRTLLHYFSTFVFPRIISTPQDWVVRDATWMDFWFPFALFTALPVLLVRQIMRRKNPVLKFFFAWLVLGLGLHMNLVPLDATVADRWFYFPMVGLLGLVGAFLAEVRRIRPVAGPRLLRVSALALTVLAISLLAWRSYERSLEWESGYTLYSRDLEVQPDSYYLTNNFGVELFRRGRIQEAKDYFEKSTRLAPHWFTNWNNLGATYEALGDLDRAEQCYLNSLRNSSYYLAIENYAKILITKGRYQEARQFIKDVALPAFPGNQWLKAMLLELPG